MAFNIEDINKAAIKAGISDDITLRILANLPKKRSTKENSSLHKLFQHISDELNELGLTFNYNGLNGKSFETTYTPHLVKEYIWRPLQNTLLDKESTTRLSNSDIKLIFQVLEKWFAEKGVQIVFPSESEDYYSYLRGDYKK